MIKNPAAFARDLTRKLRGLLAVISRGETSCPAKVIMGRSDAVATSVNEFRIEANAQEILIAAKDYKPTGSLSLPQPGDRITVTFVDGSIGRFDARPPANGQQCFNADAFGDEFRIHCKKVAS